MTHRIVPSLILAGLALLAGCESSPADTGSEPIEITISGVEEGASYTSPVVIDIATDRGTFSATLDGDLFVSGRTVSQIGPHTLEVIARDGADTDTATVSFEMVFTGSSTLIVRMIDLGDNGPGGGDAILLSDSAQGLQMHALVDAGPFGVGGEVTNAAYVEDRLRALNVGRLEAMILTHAHSDHFRGMPAILSGITVERFIYNGQLRNSYSEYTQLISLANSRAEAVLVPDAVLTLPLSGAGGTQLEVIPPLPDHLSDSNASGSELNEGSLGTAVTRGAFSMFMTGDGEYEANARWRQSYAAESGGVDVLKAGHHGANNSIFDVGTSGSSTWLDHTNPDIVLISANGSSHPRHNALTKIMNRTDTRTYCTPVHGDIELRVNPIGDVSVTVEKNEGMDCVAGSDATS